MSQIKPFADAYLATNQASAGSLLNDLHGLSLKELAQRSVPTRKTENWRYSARHLDISPELARQLSPVGELAEIPEQIKGLGDQRVVFINGRFQSRLSTLAPGDGIRLETLANLGTGASRLDQWLAEPSTLAEHSFAAVNGAHLLDGLRLVVAPDVQIRTPIQVIFATTDEEGSAHARLVVEAGKNSAATLIEEYLYLGQETNSPRQLNTAVTQVSLAANAQLNLIRLSLEPESIQQVGLTLVNQSRDSQFHSHSVGFGGKVKRHDLIVKLEESGAFCRLNGAYLTRNAQHYDNHTRIEHIAPNCESSETYRGIADNDSHAVFNGQILIHRDAQKSLANMSNKNLLLSSNAEIDTKPELEIYADDVKCSHGATIGQLDKESLFYLVSRGISPETAASMLSMGFINELLEQIPSEPVQQVLADRLHQFLMASFSAPAQGAR